MAYGSCKKTSITQDPFGFETWDLLKKGGHSPPYFDSTCAVNITCFYS